MLSWHKSMYAGIVCLMVKPYSALGDKTGDWCCPYNMNAGQLKGNDGWIPLAIVPSHPELPASRKGKHQLLSFTCSLGVERQWVGAWGRDLAIFFFRLLKQQVTA